MPQATLKEEPKWRLPADIPLPAVLNEVKEERKQGTSRAGKPYDFTQWTWEFQIADGEYQGIKVWADTDAAFTNHPENRVRQYAEALLGAELELGMGLDTDDLIGLPCEIVVANETYENAKGETKYITPITQIYPAGTTIDAGNAPF